MIIAYLNTSVNNYFKSYFNLFYFHRIYVLYAATFKIVIFEHSVCSIFQNHLVCFFQLDFVLYSNFIRFARQQFGALHTKALCMQKNLRIPTPSESAGSISSYLCVQSLVQIAFHFLRFQTGFFLQSGADHLQIVRRRCLLRAGRAAD